MIDGGFRDRCCADVDGFFMIPCAIALTGRAGDSVFAISFKLCSFLISLDVVIANSRLDVMSRGIATKLVRDCTRPILFWTLHKYK